MKFIPWPSSLSKKKLIALIILIAIILNLTFTLFIIHIQRKNLLKESVLSQSELALSLLSRDVGEGNYRRVMEQLLSKELSEGVKIKSILFYDLISKEEITSNTGTKFICNPNMPSSYYKSGSGQHAYCIFINKGLLVQITFALDSFGALGTPQVLMVFSLNFLFAIALTVLTLLGMNLYLDRFILLLNRLLKKGEIDKNVPQEFKGSFKSIKNLSHALDEMKKMVSESTREKVSHEISQKVLHNIKTPLSNINTILPLLRNSFDKEKEEMLRGSIQEIEESVSKALEYKKNKPLAKVNLYNLVEQAASEIRFQNSQKQDLVISEVQSCPFSSSYTKEVDPIDFKAAITNILNNAIEAMSLSPSRTDLRPNFPSQSSSGSDGDHDSYINLKDHDHSDHTNHHSHHKGHKSLKEGEVDQIGEIKIHMKEQDNSISICITDEGPGFSDKALPHIGTQGFTYGKKGGHGLGLYTARLDIESWGGKITFGNQKGAHGAWVCVVI